MWTLLWIFKLISIWCYLPTVVTLCLSSWSAFDAVFRQLSLCVCQAHQHLISFHTVTLCLSSSSAFDAIFPQLSLCVYQAHQHLMQSARSCHSVFIKLISIWFSLPTVVTLCLSSSSAFDALCPQLSLCVWRRRWPAEVWSSWWALSNDWVPSTQREAAHWAVLLLWRAEQEHSEWAHRDLRLPAVCAQPSQHIPRKLPLGEWKQHMLHLWTDRNGLTSIVQVSNSEF